MTYRTRLQRTLEGEDYGQAQGESPQTSLEDMPPAALGTDSMPVEADTAISTKKPKSKLETLRIRLASTAVILILFYIIFYFGHFPLVALVLVLQNLMSRELFNLTLVSEVEQHLPGFRVLMWLFNILAQASMAFRWLRRMVIAQTSGLETDGPINTATILLILQNSNFIFFGLYVISFIAFVISLTRGHYRYQFGQYAWTHLVIILTLLPSSFYVMLVFEGIIWFLAPVFLVVINDSFAYLWGITLGRTPLIRISPKKTVEGFLGAILTTVIASWFISEWLSRYPSLTCPKETFDFQRASCQPSPVFQSYRYRMNMLQEVLPAEVVGVLALPAHYLPPKWWSSIANFEFNAKPVNIHFIFLAMGASLIAPFGGFFASGLKRAFRLKDFADTIPGHGGITDRFDCQLMMSVFTYMYYVSYVKDPEHTTWDLLLRAKQLDEDSLRDLFLRLTQVLVARDLLPASLKDSIFEVAQCSQGSGLSGERVCTWSGSASVE